MARGLKFDSRDSYSWATNILGELADIPSEISQNTRDGLLNIAANLESKKHYKILDKGLMLNPILVRPLDRETINRYFRLFKAEPTNKLHSELLSSREYLNIYHKIELGN